MSTVSVDSSDHSIADVQSDMPPVPELKRRNAFIETFPHAIKKVCKSPSSTLSTESVGSYDLSTADVENDMSTVPELKTRSASKESSIDNDYLSHDEEFLQRFSVPVSQKLKQCKSIEDVTDKVRNKFIRECLTCIQAVSNSRTISTNEFKLAAKKICKTVPILCDPKPPNISEDVVFPYWVGHNIILSIIILMK